MRTCKRTQTELTLLLILEKYKLCLHMLVSNIYSRFPNLSDYELSNLISELNDHKKAFARAIDQLEAQHVGIPVTFRESIQLTTPYNFQNTRQLRQYFKDIDNYLDAFITVKY